MIRPHKYINLETCVLRVAAAVLAALRERGPLTLDEVDDSVGDALGMASRTNLMPGLVVCYSLGTVEYDRDLGVLRVLELEDRK